MMKMKMIRSGSMESRGARGAAATAHGHGPRASKAAHAVEGQLCGGCWGPRTIAVQALDSNRLRSMFTVYMEFVRRVEA